MAATVLAVLTSAVAGTPDEKDAAVAPRIMFPPDQALLLSGNFDVIVRTTAKAELLVDGKPHAWEAFAPPIHVARLSLEPGRHVVQIDDQKREFVVALYADPHAGPPGWEPFKHHPIGSEEDRCADCHETSRQNGKTAVGLLKSYKACFECHMKVDFDVAHCHPLEPLESCKNCHALHASSRQSLLRAPAKELCSKCHQS